MNQAELVQIVSKVIAALRAAAPKKRVLVLFGGASTGFVAGMEAIKQMVSNGHEVTVVLSYSARHIIGEDHVKQAGATRIILPDTWANAPALVRDADLVLVPTLSMNTAAHLAQGLMDSLLSTLVLGALMAGKPVIAICDGANPRGNGGKVFGAKPDAAVALQNKLLANLATLAEYGVELVHEPDFWLAVDCHLLGLGTVAPAETPDPAITNAPPPVLGLSGAFITQTDLAGLPAGSVVRLAVGTKLTPLARDTAARLRLTLLEK